MNTFLLSPSSSSKKTGIFWLFVCLFLILAGPALAHEGHRENRPAGNSVEADGMAETNALERTVGQPVEKDLREGQNSGAGINAVDLLGRLHPAAAHFPIALLLTAAFAELLLVVCPRLGLAPTVRFLVFVGAGGALGTAILGWFAGGFRLTDRDPTLGLHRWNGTAIAAIALLTAAVAAWTKGRRAGLRLLLGVLSIAIILQGFLGGELTFGPNHLGI